MPQELLEAKKLELIQEKVKKAFHARRESCSHICRSTLKKPPMQHVDVERRNGHEREKYRTFVSENVVTEVEDEIEVAEVEDETSTGDHHGVFHDLRRHNVETADSPLHEEIHGWPATTIVTSERLIIVPLLLLYVQRPVLRLADNIAHR